jgi:DNA-binding response OmpR family regulator
VSDRSGTHPNRGAAGGPSTAAPAAAGGKGPVLVVEDEPGLAEVLALHLRAAGYAPVVAPDGLAALHALDGPPPRAILLDLYLPQVSGFRLLAVLRQRPALARVPVLVLTALSFAEARDVARSGVVDFITKPFDPAAVVRRLDRLLDGASAAAP